MILEDYIHIALDSLEFGAIVMGFVVGIFLLFALANVMLHLTMFLTTKGEE